MYKFRASTRPLLDLALTFPHKLKIITAYSLQCALENLGTTGSLVELAIAETCFSTSLINFNQSQSQEALLSILVKKSKLGFIKTEPTIPY